MADEDPERARYWRVVWWVLAVALLCAMALIYTVARLADDAERRQDEAGLAFGLDLAPLGESDSASRMRTLPASSMVNSGLSLRS